MNDNQLTNLWQSTFGTDYTKRKIDNQSNEEALREMFWTFLPSLAPSASSYLEIGCNAGMNTNALYKGNSSLKITGLEPNEFAYKTAVDSAKGKYNVIQDDILNMSSDVTADLVFTCTVLIHINPDSLKAVMDRIFEASNQYILAMEYYWPCEKQVNYRGNWDALWKRDYGAIWLNNYNLSLIETGYLDERDGFDRTTWWLLEKNKL
jgi:pseudaminic acid biosynthesis-associated methylase